MNRHEFILNKHFEVNEVSYEQIKKYVLLDNEDYCESFVVPSCLDGYVEAREKMAPVVNKLLWKIRHGQVLDRYEIGSIRRGRELSNEMEPKEMSEICKLCFETYENNLNPDLVKDAIAEDRIYFDPPFSDEAWEKLQADPIE